MSIITETSVIGIKLIHQNPYRILGIPINCSERELQKQITKANRFAEVGKSITSDTDFPFFGDFDRDIESIKKATKYTEQTLERILYSSFWFLNGNHIDQVAFESLQKGNTEKAIEIWEKVVGDGQVSEKKLSNLLNLKSLYLGLSILNNGENFNKNFFLRGIELSGKFLNHENYEGFCKTLVGNNFELSIGKIEDIFFNSILIDLKPYLSNGIEIKEIISSLNTFSKETQLKISQKFSSGESNRIESEIDNTVELRNINPSESYFFGLNLYENTKNDIHSLSKILGKSDVKYQMIANKLANELLQCGIDYFNKNHNGLTNTVALKSYDLCKKAKSIVEGGQTKERVEENLKIIKESCDDGIDTSNYQENIRLEIEKIEKHIQEFFEKKGKSAVVVLFEAKNLVNRTKESREIILNVHGNNDEGYIKICDIIVVLCLGAVIDYVNLMAPISGVNREEVNFLSSLGNLTMSPSTKIRYHQNLRTLNEMFNRSNSGGGCYIATMVYGDYEHPQVIVLRNFRDTFLSKYFVGQIFINFYYKYSPSWVRILKNKKIINQLIKYFLDKLIKILK